MLGSIDDIRGTVLVNRKSWKISDIEELEFQDRNYKGLFFWYNQILEEIAGINKTK